MMDNNDTKCKQTMSENSVGSIDNRIMQRDKVVQCFISNEIGKEKSHVYVLPKHGSLGDLYSDNDRMRKNHLSRQMSRSTDYISPEMKYPEEKSKSAFNKVNPLTKYFSKSSSDLRKKSESRDSSKGDQNKVDNNSGGKIMDNSIVNGSPKAADYKRVPSLTHHYRVGSVLKTFDTSTKNEISTKSKEVGKDITPSDSLCTSNPVDYKRVPSMTHHYRVGSVLNSSFQTPQANDTSKKKTSFFKRFGKSSIFKQSLNTNDVSSAVDPSNDEKRTGLTNHAFSEDPEEDNLRWEEEYDIIDNIESLQNQPTVYPNDVIVDDHDECHHVNSTASEEYFPGKESFSDSVSTCESDVSRSGPVDILSHSIGRSGYDKNVVVDLLDIDDEDGVDSGTDNVTEKGDKFEDSMYFMCLENIQHLLHDAKLIANLYVRLANKFSDNLGKNEAEDEPERTQCDQYISCAEIVHTIVSRNNLVNFNDVLSYILGYIGVIKSEIPEPENTSPPNLLIFIGEMITRHILTIDEVNMMACCLASRPTTKLTAHHSLRVEFLRTCFEYTMSQLNVHTQHDVYMITCFTNLCQHILPLDTVMASSLLTEYIQPHMEDHSDVFMKNVLLYMGLLGGAETSSVIITTHDITAALVLLEMMFTSCRWSLTSAHLLYAFLQQDNPKFMFCSLEREHLLRTLKKIINQ